MKYDGKILIIPDSNFLFLNLNRKTDFREFTFNSNFFDLIQTIEVNDLLDKCVIGLSEVVLEELLIQRIEAYNEQIDKLKQLTSNYIFPHLSFEADGFDKFNYVEYISKTRADFIKAIKSKLIEFIDLPIPNQIRFTSIIRRAFEKRPPFEGIKGKSDKGFKDALLWESILDLKLNSDFSNVIICTSDQRMQNPELTKEFNEVNPNINIEMISLPFLNEVLRGLVTENLDFTDTSVSIQEISEFLSSDPVWMMDINVDEDLVLDNFSEYSIVNFDVLDYELISEENLKVLVNLEIELVDNEKNIIMSSKRTVLLLKHQNGEWFYIQSVFEGDHND